VLLVEDDLPAREYLTKRFYQETSLGVVVAKDLVEAKNLIDSSDIQIDAIVADLYFGFGMDNPESGLRDGIDILSYGASHRPQVLGYVNSYWADRREYVDKAASLHVSVRQWFHKQPLLPGDVSSPWAQVERDLIGARLRRQTDVDPATSSLTTISEAIRQQICPIRKTYIQDVGEPHLQVRRPIEVLTWCAEDGVYHASAPRLGLLTDGDGDSVTDAIDSLCKLISEHWSDLDDRTQTLEGYAKFVKSQLDVYLESKS